MTNLVAGARQAIALLISLVVSVGVLANASSRFYTENVPDLALALNPANPDARLRMVELAFADEENVPDFDTQNSIIEDGISFEPYDARLYSLLGVISELAGDSVETAQSYFTHALALNPSDNRALLRRLAYNASQGRYKEALEQAEIIFRAWPQYWELIEPALPPLLSTEEGYEQAYERFSTLPGGPQSMLSSLSKSDAGLAIAKRLLVDWHSDGAEDLRPAINTITARLARAGQPLQAFLLFGVTLNSAERDAAGYIFNPRFALDPNGNIFDWQIPRVPGVGVRIVDSRDSSQSGSPANAARSLEMKFLNTPVRLSRVLQTVRLPAANFKWLITYSTRRLKDPKPIQLLLMCLNKNKLIESVTLTSTDDEIRTIEIDLSVPASDCALQKIVIDNGNLVESWQNRYSGSITLHELQLQLSGS